MFNNFTLRVTCFCDPPNFDDESRLMDPQRFCRDRCFVVYGNSLITVDSLISVFLVSASDDPVSKQRLLWDLLISCC